MGHSDIGPPSWGRGTDTVTSKHDGINLFQRFGRAVAILDTSLVSFLFWRWNPGTFQELWFKTGFSQLSYYILHYLTNSLNLFTRCRAWFLRVPFAAREGFGQISSSRHWSSAWLGGAAAFFALDSSAVGELCCADTLLGLSRKQGNIQHIFCTMWKAQQQTYHLGKVYTTHFWWFGGWFVVALGTKGCNHQQWECSGRIHANERFMWIIYIWWP